MSNILSLFKSRKFWLAVIGVIQTVFFFFWPEAPEGLWEAINTILLILIGAIAVEDAALKISGNFPSK